MLMAPIGKPARWLVCLKAVKEFIFDCLWPKICFGCGREGTYMCPACFDKMELQKQERCLLCGVEAAGGVCTACRTASGLDAIVVAATYHEHLSGVLVEALKYRYLESVAEPLASLLEKRLDQELLLKVRLGEFTLIPIPLHKKRLAERGFNQAELIAELLAERLKLPLNLSILSRIRSTKQQAKLSRQERLVNMELAFGAIMAVPEKVLILDDVLTTGATMKEAALILKKAGAKEVIALAVCHG